jgi:peptidyl-prolyl cis-trans isomerase C
MTHSTLKRFSPFAIILLSLSLAGCGADLVTATSTPSLSPTLTATPVPMAVIVNGEGITQAEFDAELARYQQSQAELGNAISPEQAAQVVLNDLVNQALLAQDAFLNGYIVDDVTLQTRIDALAAQIGGNEALLAWEAAHGYTDADFRSALRRQMAAAWKRDQVVATVPLTAEQVHVKQILFYNAEDAQNVYVLLQSGWDFNALAEQYEPLTKGELGWFPRGYLGQPAIEEAAFGLQPGEYSLVVQSTVGYHILYLVERDPARSLSPDALLTLQENALEDWLTQQRNASTIVVAP